MLNWNMCHGCGGKGWVSPSYGIAVKCPVCGGTGWSTITTQPSVPNVPNIPSVPNVPNVPSVPNVPYPPYTPNISSIVSAIYTDTHKDGDLAPQVYLDDGDGNTYKRMYIPPICPPDARGDK